MISQNLALVKNKIEKAAKRAGRDASEIHLICVTKTANVLGVKEVITSGALDIGENRVQDALLKYTALSNMAKSVRWHMIGHLQTNKVGKCLKIFDSIHSLDSLALAQEIDKQARALRKRIDCFIEVNVSGEPSKYGVAPEDTSGFVEKVSCLEHINIIGLMAMAPAVRDAEDARPYFKKLRFLRDSLQNAGMKNQGIKELSMGMTQDFEVAIEEGATFVRIGSAIF
jgi:PLP dependent protein